MRDRLYELRETVSITESNYTLKWMGWSLFPMSQVLRAFEAAG